MLIRKSKNIGRKFEYYLLALLLIFSRITCFNYRYDVDLIFNDVIVVKNILFFITM